MKLKLHSPLTERGLFRWSLVYGHAGVHYHQRPLHAGHATLRRLPSHEYFLVAQVAAIPQHGALRLPEHADSRVQRRLSHSVSIFILFCIHNLSIVAQIFFSFDRSKKKKWRALKWNVTLRALSDGKLACDWYLTFANCLLLLFIWQPGSSTASSNTSCAAFNINGINEEKSRVLLRYQSLTCMQAGWR